MVETYQFIEFNGNIYAKAFVRSWLMFQQLIRSTPYPEICRWYSTINAADKAVVQEEYLRFYAEQA